MNPVLFGKELILKDSSPKIEDIHRFQAYIVYVHPRWFAGFLNHQLYDWQWHENGRCMGQGANVQGRGKKHQFLYQTYWSNGKRPWLLKVY